MGHPEPEALEQQEETELSLPCREGRRRERGLALMGIQATPRSLRHISETNGRLWELVQGRDIYS